MLYHPLSSLLLSDVDQNNIHPLMMYYTANKTSGNFFYKSNHHFLRFIFSVSFLRVIKLSPFLLILTHLKSRINVLKTMPVTNLPLIQQQIIRYGMTSYLALGLIGNILNCIMFTRPLYVAHLVLYISFLSQLLA